MQLGDVNNGCQYFYLEHSPVYQKIQFSFLDAVETFEPNAIAVRTEKHNYNAKFEMILCLNRENN